MKVVALLASGLVLCAAVFFLFLRTQDNILPYDAARAESESVADFLPQNSGRIRFSLSTSGRSPQTGVGPWWSPGFSFVASGNFAARWYDARVAFMGGQKTLLSRRNKDVYLGLGRRDVLLSQNSPARLGILSKLEPSPLLDLWRDLPSRGSSGRARSVFSQEVLAYRVPAFYRDLEKIPAWRKELRELAPYLRKLEIFFASKTYAPAGFSLLYRLPGSEASQLLGARSLQLGELRLEVIYLLRPDEVRARALRPSDKTALAERSFARSVLPLYGGR